MRENHCLHKGKYVILYVINYEVLRIQAV